MTTIACDGMSMAADGQRVHCGTIIATNAEKLRRLPDGRIVGTSGDCAFGIMFVEWLKGGCEDDKPESKGDAGFNALVLSPDGTAEFYDDDCVPLAVQLPAAIGSGMDFALAAMEAGVPALQAVEIAAKRDVNTGGKITVMFPEPHIRAVA